MLAKLKDVHILYSLHIMLTKQEIFDIGCMAFETQVFRVLKAKLEEVNIVANESTLAAPHQKHNRGKGELAEQIDSINKHKAKSKKDRAGMEHNL